MIDDIILLIFCKFIARMHGHILGYEYGTVHYNIVTQTIFENL